MAFSPGEIMRRQCSLVLDDEFMATVKISQLLYSEPFMGVLVTQDEKVFLIKADKDGCSGPTPIPRLTRLEALCGQKIRSFSAGGTHILALSEGGVVYAWGCNSYGQLGDGSINDSTLPIVVAGDLTNHVVREIAGGNGFSLALTEDGEVHSWGDSTYGQNRQVSKRAGHQYPASITSPKLLDGFSDDIVSIAASYSSAVCLNDAGEIFALRYSNISGSSIFRELSGHYVEKIQTGSSHTLALTSLGILFAWGSNEYGQLGTGVTSSATSPTRINFTADEAFDVHVMDISTVMKYTSCAVDVDGETYIWGFVNGGTVLRPTKSTAGVTESRLFKPTSNVASDILASFNDETTSDIVITIEKKKIHVHQSVLQIRSEYFRTMFSGSWKETQKNEISVEHYSYEVYHAFLKYIYSGELLNVDAATAMKLLDLARCAMDELLMNLCNQQIRKKMSFKNVAVIFSLAMTLDQESLVRYCVRYAMRDMASVIKSTAFNELSGDHVKILLNRAVDGGLFI